MATSPSTGLVLKIFSNNEEFLAEQSIYMLLNRSGVRHIPHYFGAYQNEWMQVKALLISHQGRPIKDEDSFTLSEWCVYGLPSTGSYLTVLNRWHLGTIVWNLHQAGIHHHDLKKSNIVRSTADDLSMIDFGLSSTANSCKSECCIDWVWLRHGM